MSSRKASFTVETPRRLAAGLGRAGVVERATLGWSAVSPGSASRACFAKFFGRFQRVWAKSVFVGAGCPSVGGQRAGVIHRERAGLALGSLALPAAKPPCWFGSGIGFAHAGSGFSLRPPQCIRFGGRVSPNPSLQRTASGVR